ncbi:glutathione S-transferase N-terminal domain-containing protein [Humitalea sp. 24SJ18S-53]|uniref:glutathione S-transferase N-terminal domain-containing protein n=1 Tax=Humitalea sp. 24SJ18S-53 TaxID=3422307 RepID=UPI003D67BA45
MKLFWSSRSPFARKVVAVAHELGIADRIALERVIVSGTQPNESVMAYNPLSQIPTLVLDDGSALFDSAVIVAFLDLHHGPNVLLPGDPRQHFAVLRHQALGDGIMENSVRRLAERARGPLGSPQHAAANWFKISRTLDRLETEAASLEPATAGSIAIACGIAHLDFRHAADDWRGGRPALAAWFARFSTRPSMRATEYRDEH